LTAAEAVCGDDEVPAGEILDVVSRLVDKSLITAADAAGETRFTQHRNTASARTARDPVIGLPAITPRPEAR
jgi:hypothetical protein